MATAVDMIHPNTKLIKKGYIGFSWTSFFFSGIPAIIRGEVGIGVGILLTMLILGSFTFGILSIIINLVWAFKFNKHYTIKLLEKGYEFSGEENEIINAKTALGIAV